MNLIIRVLGQSHQPAKRNRYADMTWLEKIKLNLFIRATHHQLALTSTPDLSAFKKTNIAILFNGTNPQDRHTADKLVQELRDNGHNVSVLGYVDTYAEAVSYSFKHFYRKNLNWYYLPTHDDIESFLRLPYHILINLAPADLWPMHYIAARAQARFKIGPYCHHLKIYQLMLSDQNELDLNDTIAQIKKLLSTIQYHG